MAKEPVLTRREREIMDALFALDNRASADQIRARLPKPPSSSSVRVMLARLERKGYLRHRQVGIRHVYSATTSPHLAKRTAIENLVETFFRGSLGEMVSSLLKEGSWSEDELARLREQIDAARKGSKQS